MQIVIDKLKSLFEIKNEIIRDSDVDFWFNFEIDNIDFAINYFKDSYYLYYSKVGEFTTPFDSPQEEFKDTNQLIGFIQGYIQRNKE